MGELIGHRSTLLFLVLVSYVCWRLSTYGKRPSDKIAFKITLGVFLFLFGAYFIRNIVPGVEVIAVVSLVIIGLWIYLILPGPEYKVSIPPGKKKALMTELLTIGLLTLVVMGLWQRVAP